MQQNISHRACIHTICTKDTQSFLLDWSWMIMVLSITSFRSFTVNMIFTPIYFLKDEWSGSKTLCIHHETKKSSFPNAACYTQSVFCIQDFLFWVEFHIQNWIVKMPQWFINCMKIYMELSFATWPKMVKLTEMKVKEF